MAISLVPCPACKKQVSTGANSCPNCGHRGGFTHDTLLAPEMPMWIIMIITGIIGLFILLAFLVIWSFMPDFEYWDD